MTKTILSWQVSSYAGACDCMDLHAFVGTRRFAVEQCCVFDHISFVMEQWYNW